MFFTWTEVSFKEQVRAGIGSLFHGGPKLAALGSGDRGLPPEPRWQTAPGAGRPAGCTCGCLESGLLSYLLRTVQFRPKEEKAPSQGCRSRPRRVVSVALTDAQSNHHLRQDPQQPSAPAPLASLRVQPRGQCVFSVPVAVPLRPRDSHTVPLRPAPSRGVERFVLCCLPFRRFVRRVGAPSRLLGAFTPWPLKPPSASHAVHTSVSRPRRRSGPSGAAGRHGECVRL